MRPGSHTMLFQLPSFVLRFVDDKAFIKQFHDLSFNLANALPKFQSFQKVVWSESPYLDWFPSFFVWDAVKETEYFVVLVREQGSDWILLLPKNLLIVIVPRSSNDCFRYHDTVSAVERYYSEILLPWQK